MKPTRRSQPHRRGRSRQPSAVLDAMRRGAPAHLPNPKDTERAFHKKRRKGRRSSLYARSLRY